MADISSIKIPNGDSYNIKDSSGRTTAATKAVADNYLSVATYTSSNTTINASSAVNINVTITRSGYTPLGIVGVYLTGDRCTYCHEIAWWLTSSTNARVAVRNYYTNDKAVIKATVYVLYRKN